MLEVIKTIVLLCAMHSGPSEVDKTETLACQRYYVRCVYGVKGGSKAKKLHQCIDARKIPKKGYKLL